MITEITKVEFSEDAIVLEGVNLETIFTSDNLYEEIDEEVVRFKFDREENGGAALKYLYKVCQSQKACKREKSLGEKIEKLVGCIISLGENFIER